MKMSRFLMLLFISATACFVSCAPKNTDIDIKNSIEAKLKTRPDMAGITVDVKGGIVTVDGQCRDDSSKTTCEKITQEVSGVKTVINNLIVANAPPAPAPEAVTTPPIIEILDDPLTTSVTAAVKRYPAVNAVVKDSIISLTGEIKKAELPGLIKTLSALKPKKIDNKLSIQKAARVTRSVKSPARAKHAANRKKRGRRR